MTEQKINHAALTYANLWWRTDRVFLHNMRAVDTVELKNHVRELAAAYKVARTFGAKGLSTEEHSERWMRVTKCLVSVKPFASDQAVSQVERLAKAMGSCFDCPPRLSAASKFLWFRGHFDVRIYDTRVVSALGEKYPSVRTKSYQAMCEAWHREFELNKSAIKRAVKDLPGVLTWTAITDDKESHSKAKQAFKQQWFLERVFDQYLWETGRITSSV